MEGGQVRSRTRDKWKTLTAEQQDMLMAAVAESSEPNATFEGFAETARSFMESIPGLETHTEREASRLVNQLWSDYMAKKPTKAKKAEKSKKGAKQSVQDHEQESGEERGSEPSKAPSRDEAVTAKLNLDKKNVKEAIAQGKALIKDGKSKADAAKAIYVLIKDEEKEVIVAAFVEGATLTEKGALTYWYNCKRWAAKETKPNT